MKRPRLFILCLMIIYWSSFPTLAQTFRGLSALDELVDSAQQAGTPVLDIAFILSGIIAAIMLIPAAIKAWKGESQSKDSIISVGLGLLAIFIILGLIKAMMAFN